MKEKLLGILFFLRAVFTNQQSTISQISTDQRSYGSQLTYMTYLTNSMCQDIHFKVGQQDYPINSRFFMVQQTTKQIIMNSFKGNILAIQFGSFGILLLWTCMFLTLSYFILKACCKTMNKINRIIDTQLTPLAKIEKKESILSFLLLQLFFCTIITAICAAGMLQSSQIEKAASDTICSILVGNTNQNSHNILIRQGEGRSQFHVDSLQYQLKLLSVRQKSEKILKSKAFKQFQREIEARNAEFNLVERQEIKRVFKDITSALYRLQNQATMVSKFIIYVKSKIQNLRFQLINSFRQIESFVGKTEYLPGLISYWLRTLFFMILFSNMALGCAFLNLIKKRAKSNIIFKKSTNYLNFFIYIASITLLVLFVIENYLYLTCLREHDYKNRLRFEEYFQRYEDYEEPLLRELMRKIQGHSLQNLQTAEGYDISLASNYALSKIDQFKNLFQSQQSIFFGREQSSNHSYSLKIDNRTRQLSVAFLKIIDYLQDYEQDLRNIFRLSSSKAKSILQYNFTQIRNYKNAIKNQICHIDLSIIFKINNYLFICIFGVIFELFILSLCYEKINITQFERCQKDIEGWNGVESADSQTMNEVQPFNHKSQAAK